MMRARVAAPAKINLTLEVVERLPTGFHRLRSIFVKLHKLADALTVAVSHGDGVRITSNCADVPCDATNLCYRAASDYLQAIGERASVHVHIDKLIPVAAGMGGGSSDAAAVLRAMNAHYSNGLARDALARVGMEIGKDVPFFLMDADVAFVTGMGELITPLPSLPSLSFLIVNPRIAVGTREAYATLSRDLWFMEARGRVDISSRMQRAIETCDIDAMAGALYNDFELVVEPRHPVIREVKQALCALGAAGALMSGSGSTVFGLFASDESLQTARSTLCDRYPSFVIEVA